MSTEPNITEIFKAYEDGKHRRYSLLFAVNGGAFAIAKLIIAPQQQTSIVLGKLSLYQLSFGMAVFTIVMVSDIFVFGLRMRKKDSGLFTWLGQLVLILIGLLISVGWSLVSFGARGLVLMVSCYLIILGTLSVLIRHENDKESRSP